ncbi:MAG: hypothetical protein CSA62_06040 [Planctomycetota bacterium]|nr:MAG: hypothetical protein CSA62_06040 [Planctomycetota bacterium]
MKRVSMSFKPFTAAPSPAPFSIRLKGDSPFVAVKPTLVIDWKTYSKTNETHPNFYIDAHRLSGTSSGRSGYTTPIGKPCNPNNFYSYAMGYNEGQRFKPFCYTRYVGDHVLHWIGSKEIKMPIAGQPGCTLYTTPIAFHPVIAKTTNTSSLLFSWGRVPKGMKGASVICQFAAIDKTFTSMRWSRATKAVFGDYKVTYPYTISHRYNYGSGTRTFDPDKDNANSGSAGRAAVFQIK